MVSLPPVTPYSIAMMKLWKKSPPLTLSIPPLHRTHAFKPHTPCGHYIDTQCLGKGAPIFESLGEAILHNSPNASGNVDFSPIFTHPNQPI